MSVTLKWFPPARFQITSKNAIIYIDPAYLRSYYTQYPRSGFKIPSKAQWPRCRPPANAHIPMYAALSRSSWRLALEPDLEF